MAPVLIHIQGTVQKDCGNAAFPELVHLILHQRNQGGHNNRESVKNKRRNLIAERFTTARRHDDEGVFALQNMPDDLFLEGPETVITEDIFQDGFNRAGHVVSLK